MIRMFEIDPRGLCDYHLLNEHAELHEFAYIARTELERAERIAKERAVRGAIDTERIKSRHDELASEMLCRGIRHDSPMDDYTDEINVGGGCINPLRSAIDLNAECDDCRLKGHHGFAGSDPKDGDGT